MNALVNIVKDTSFDLFFITTDEISANSKYKQRINYRSSIRHIIIP